MIPDTNSGTTVPDRPTTVIVRSIGRPTCRAEITPPTMLSGTTRANATAASFIELSSASWTNGRIGSR